MPNHSLSLAVEQTRSLVAELGSDPDLLLADVGLTGTEHTEAQRKSVMEAVGHMVMLGAKRTHCRHFGALLAARRVFPNYFGPLGRMVWAAPDLGSAIQDYCRYLGIHVEGSRWYLEREGGLARLRNCTVGEADGQVAEHNIVLTTRLLRILTENQWQPHLIHLETPDSGGRSVLRDLLQCPVIFEAEHSCIDFNSDFLPLPLRSSDEELWNILHSLVDSPCNTARESLEKRVADIIDGLLSSGKCSVDIVSRNLNISRSTLQRKLSERETSYRQILESVRTKKACDLLTNSTMPIGQLSELLGYGNQCTFSRTFKQQVGTSPSAWRKTNRAPSHLNPTFSP